jgi:hypothetical protein
MAFPGYGPGQHALQWPETLALQPRAVVVGFYFGNDLVDVLKEADGRAAPPHLVDLAQRAAALERDDPIAEKAARFYRRGRETQPVRAWLVQHVMLYALIHEVRREFTAQSSSPSIQSFERAVAAITPKERPYLSIVDGPDWRTILNPTYRRLAVDQRDPRILLGFELAVEALESLAARSRAAGVDMLVVLLPTKESVFWPRIRVPVAHPELREAVLDEATLSARLVQRLERAGVEVLDLQPVLKAASAQPYFEDLDGHPSPSGHTIIAERVAAWILARR